MRSFAMGAILICLCAANAGAAVIVQDDWSSGLDDWSATNSARTGPAYGTLSNVGGTLRITGGAADPGVKEDYIFENVELAGNRNYMNWGGGTGRVWAAQFSFYAGAGGVSNVPSGLSVYFLSQGSYVWYYDITPVEGWGFYYANLIFSDGWYNTEGRNTEAYFLTDLTDVDEIGIMLRYQPNVANQIYGLDDFQLLDEPVPEPGTYAMAGTVFLAAGMVFRPRLRQMWRSVRDRFRV